MSLESKIKKLQVLCSRYESNEFLTFLAGILLQIGIKEKNPFLKHLMSPMRQLFYLGFLNLKFNSGKNKIGFSEQEWDEMTSLLHEIEMDYFYMLGFPKNGKETREEIEKISVTMPTFMNYFFSGPLAYEEQELERIENIFKPFEHHFMAEWNLTTNDFIQFYHHLTTTTNNNLNTAIKFANPSNWRAFTKSCIEKGLMDPKDWINEAPEEINGFVNFARNPGSFLVVDLDNSGLSSESRGKFTKIVSLLSYSDQKGTEIIYYTDDNGLLKHPLISLDGSTYLAFYCKQYVHACYQLLFNECLKIDSDKILRLKDEFIEDKTKSIFKKLFPKDAFFYVNYSIDDGQSEQDLLVIYKRIALVIEVKAASYRAPMRNPEKAYEKLKADFRKCIQYGVNQTSRVTEAFRKQNVVRITNLKGQLLYEIKPTKYKVFPIVVTFERFGHIQTDLSGLLTIADDDDYPWCVNIDDLEAFVLTLKKRSNVVTSFFTFLEYRQHFHGHLICSDELELCGMFLKDINKFKQMSLSDNTVVTAPDLTAPIEHSYREGMGFANERLFKEKRDKAVGFLYSND